VKCFNSSWGKKRRSTAKWNCSTAMVSGIVPGSPAGIVSRHGAGCNVLSGDGKCV
jgi:hypothetical protein